MCWIIKYGDRKKKKVLVSFINMTFFLYILLYSENCLRREKEDDGVHNCFPAQTFHQFWFYFDVENKLSPIHLFLSSISWFLTIPFLSCLEWELIFTVPSHRPGRECFHAWNFCNVFSKSQHYCFSALFQHLSIWRKGSYRIDTERQAGRTLGYSVFRRDWVDLEPLGKLRWEESLSLFFNPEVSENVWMIWKPWKKKSK